MASLVLPRPPHQPRSPLERRTLVRVGRRRARLRPLLFHLPPLRRGRGYPEGRRRFGRGCGRGSAAAAGCVRGEKNAEALERPGRRGSWPDAGRGIESRARGGTRGRRRQRLRGRADAAGPGRCCWHSPLRRVTRERPHPSSRHLCVGRHLELVAPRPFLSLPSSFLARAARNCLPPLSLPLSHFIYHPSPPPSPLPPLCFRFP